MYKVVKDGIEYRLRFAYFQDMLAPTRTRRERLLAKSQLHAKIVDMLDNGTTGSWLSQLDIENGKMMDLQLYRSIAAFVTMQPVDKSTLPEIMEVDFGDDPAEPYGIAICDPDDQYNRNVGRTIALTTLKNKINGCVIMWKQLAHENEDVANAVKDLEDSRMIVVDLYKQWVAAHPKQKVQ